MMSTLRQDPTTNEWVILAPERGARPLAVQPDRLSTSPHDPTCPFCPGNENLTPPEIDRRPAQGGWQIRVFPNLFPALSPDGSTERRGEPCAREMEGVGRHEVIVESPLHDERLEDMPVDRLATVLQVWRDRYRALIAEPWAKAVVVFKNFGPRAGTSLVHPHSQILATPVVPPDTLHRYAVATRYHDDTGRCVYLDLIEREIESRERLVAERSAFVAVAPFAATLPYETWIAPRTRQPSFGQVRDEELAELADILRDVVAGLRRAAGDPDYNLVVQSAPVTEESKPFFMWHLRVLPRLVTPAGFELGSGMSINLVPPERAAEEIRAALARTPAR